MSVFEMLREFGYMRCIGASPSHIFRIVLFETLLLCLGGGVTGVVFGMIFASVTDEWLHNLLPYAPAGRFILFDPLVIAASVLFAALAGGLAGIIPGLKAAHASPMEAVRNV
jgi:putative ABC transport system permease protein